MSRAAALVAALVLRAAGAQGAQPERRYELADQGFLKLGVPGGWLDEVRERAPQAPPTIVFRPPEGDAFLVLVTPLRRPGPGVPMPTKAGLRKRAAQVPE